MGSARRRPREAAQHMVGHMPKLAYETPVLGPPWSIPFEFPLYQWTVAAVVQVLGTPLDQTGRAVDIGFFLLTLIPLYFALDKLHIPRSYRWLVLSLLVLTPEYLYNTRLFLIESCVLFLSTWYLVVALEYLDKPRPWYGVAAAVLGCLAGLTKVTTFALFLGAVLLVYAYRCARELRASKRQNGLLYHAAVLVLLIMVPVLATWSWTKFADRTKDANVFGAKCLTSNNLYGWTFGTLKDRKDVSRYQFMHYHIGNAVNQFGPPICLAGLCLASAAWGVGRWLRRPQSLNGGQLARRWVGVATCTLLYFSGPLVFFNLYFIHDYYWCANTLFLVVAMGLCIATMIEMGRASRVVGTAVLLLVLAGSLYTYSRYYYYVQSGQYEKVPGLAALGKDCDNAMAMARIIEQKIRPDDVLVCLGHNWHSDLAYYGRRRAITPPNFISDSVEELVQHIKAIDDVTLGGLVIDRAGGPRFAPQTVLKTIERNGFRTQFLATEGNLDLYSLQKTSAAEPPAAIAAKLAATTGR